MCFLTHGGTWGLVPNANLWADQDFVEGKLWRRGRGQAFHQPRGTGAGAHVGLAGLGWGRGWRWGSSNAPPGVGRHQTGLDLFPSPSHAPQLNEALSVAERAGSALLIYSLFNWTNTQQHSLLGSPLGTGDTVTRPCHLRGTMFVL